jgi:site-specific DNA-methyltransferase (adenine-specific)
VRPKTFNPITFPCKHPGKVEKYGLERRQYFGKNHSMRIYKETSFKNTKNTKIAPNIFSYSVGKDKTGHPAPFPEKLAEDMIISWSNKGDIVLDCMCGSGTTCKMSLINNRKYIGIDISKEYCNLAEKRLAETTKQLSIK